MTTTDARQRLAAIRASRAELLKHIRIARTALMMHEAPDSEQTVEPWLRERANVIANHYGPDELRERIGRLTRQHVATAGELREAHEAFTASTARP